MEKLYLDSLPKHLLGLNCAFCRDTILAWRYLHLVGKCETALGYIMVVTAFVYKCVCVCVCDITSQKPKIDWYYCISAYFKGRD